MRTNARMGTHFSMATMLIAAGVVAGAMPGARGAVSPYVADANTLHLYHFDETAGGADPGNPIVDFTSGTALNLPNTGGPDGRDNAGAGGAGGYGATAATGFGSAFNILASGNGNYSGPAHSSTGGVRSAGAVAQSSLQGASGAFTYEALINLGGLADEQVILSHDGGMDGATLTRGFMLRLTDSADSGTNVDLLSFYNGSTSTTVALPTSGDHALATNTWFHVAVTYTGAEGATGNLTLYWTALESGAEAANSLTTATLAADLGAVSDVNWFGVGTGTRGEFRTQLRGLVDEVRISDVARGPTQFVFVPEPATLGLLGFAAGALLRRRR